MNVNITFIIPKSILDMQTRLKDACADTMKQQIPLISSEIKKRTRKGLSVDGGSFSGYSSPYARKRKSLGLSTAPVDLTRSGKMLSFIEKIEQSEGIVSGTISVPDSADKYAAAHNSGIGKQPLRNFMGLSRQQIVNFKIVLRENIYKYLRR